MVNTIQELRAAAAASPLQQANAWLHGHLNLKAYCRIQRAVILAKPRPVFVVSNVEVPLPYHRRQGYFRDFMLQVEDLVRVDSVLEAVVVENVFNEDLGRMLGKHQYTRYRCVGAEMGVFNYYRLKEKLREL